MYMSMQQRQGRVQPFQSERQTMSNSQKQTETFENTYPKHSFSELVRLSLKLARWICDHRDAGRAEEELKHSHPPSFERHT